MMQARIMQRRDFAFCHFHAPILFPKATEHKARPSFLRFFSSKSPFISAFFRIFES